MAARSRLAERGFVRPRSGRWIGGVAVGLARALDLRPSLVRLGWIVSILVPGPQFVIYVALWILMPAEDSD